MFNQSPSKIVQTNRLPFLIGFIILLLTMAFFMFKSQMNQKAQITPSKSHQSLDVSARAVDASWFNGDKFKNIRFNNGTAHHKQSAREIQAEIISSQDLGLKKEEIEDQYAADLAIKRLDDKNKVEEKKLEIQALTSPLSVDVPSTPGTQAAARPSLGTGDIVTEGLNQVMRTLKSTPGTKAPELAELGAQLITDFNNQAGKQAFLKKAPEDDDYLENTKNNPRSPYEVKAGSYIPAALITGINSDLPGNVNAQVTENVYDSVTGNYLLIPQGTKLIGEYNSSLTFGQNRVQVVWSRMIFPDGKSLDLEKMQGADIAGYTGFFDKVDNHYLRIYGNAVLLSLMGAGYDILNQQEEQSTDARAAVAANVGQKLSDVADQTLEKNLNVQPTLLIDPGYKFKIFVMKDMVLEKLDDVEGTLADAE